MTGYSDVGTGGPPGRGGGWRSGSTGGLTGLPLEAPLPSPSRPAPRLPWIGQKVRRDRGHGVVKEKEEEEEEQRRRRRRKGGGDSGEWREECDVPMGAREICRLEIGDTKPAERRGP